MKLTALAGGVGGAKLISGFSAIMPQEDLTAIVNTGDDFRWLGFYICPDLDTITYTLAGLDNPQTGWGVREESFRALERLRELGCDAWFKLGDLDLATHIFRSHRMQCGDSLSEVTRALCRANGIRARLLPMTDSHVPTSVHTDEGILEFQEYFVHRQCKPGVRGFTFEGVENAQPAPFVLNAIAESDAIVICPSNPFISISPILAVPGIRDALRSTSAAIVAVTPIIGGEAIKGPAAEMMRQLGLPVSPLTVAGFYRDFLNIFVLDRRDESLCDELATLGPSVRIADTIMDSMEARVSLAASILEMLK
jgi:LPPG:FO 2-phospho-L-lactate transferase